MERASVYLTEKAVALEKAIDFFVGETQTFTVTSNEKRLIFLAQLDYWDWEMDNLLYSYESFRERSKDWSNLEQVKTKLHSVGVLVKGNALEKMKWDRRYTKYERDNKAKVVAPREILEKVVEKWNSLLELCERKLMVKIDKEQFGIVGETDLKRFRKKI